MASQELKDSSERIGQLYPVLVDYHGHIIDGEHRLSANKNWKKVKLENIKTEKQRLVARITCNNVRRIVSSKEKTNQLGELAEIYLSEGIEKGRIAYTIMVETGMSYRWVSKYLPQRYKDASQSERACSAARHAAGRLLHAAKMDWLPQLLRPPEKKLIEVSKYVNTSRVIYIVEKSLHEKVEGVAVRLKTTPDILIQRIIEEMIKEANALAQRDIELVQCVLEGE
jgi:hypothetical protein